ncbi:uncharacterized protein LOC125769620 [Anopheles funestus]|uniref:uncharacterized protein LOC125769620 n=1 Tax=Anopheles funestus TaxID=62324 RepID=UPI0020C71EC8|nr:uncharacterized protein LOC125769620 [Anopheles funestus]
MKNASFNSAEKDTKVLRAIAPNDLKGFSLYRQKMTDMVNYAIGPFFRDLFLKDVRGEYYSLLFDETEGNNRLKEMEVTVKYFSSHLTKLMFFHLDSAFLGKATAEILLGKILEGLEAAKLPLEHLVMISKDGPKVNQSLERKINSKLMRERGFQLVDTGSCPAHIIHNAVKYALKEFGIEVSELAKVVYYYFDVPSRWEEFKKNCKKKPKKFVKFVETRWVMLGNAAQVLLHNIDELFELKAKLTHSGRKKLSYHEDVIVRVLSIKGIRSIIRFVIEVCTDAEKLIKFLETNDFVLFKIYEYIKAFMSGWLGKVYEVEKIDNVFETKHLGLDSGFKKVEEIILPSCLAMTETNEQVIITLKEGMKKYVVKLVTYLLDNNIPHEFYYLVSYMSPSKIFSTKSEETIMKLAEKVDFKLDKIRVFDEIVVLKNLKLSLPTYNNDLEFYAVLFRLHDFVELKKLFQIIITISHSNAEAERRFSSSKMVMTEKSSCMSEELFNHRKNIINGMQFFNNDLEKFIPPKELLLKAKIARQTHYEKIEKEKQEKKNEDLRLSSKKKELDEQKNVVKMKREAREELTSIITTQLKKLKNDNPQVACLKIMVEQHEKLLSEEADAQKKLGELKKDK